MSTIVYTLPTFKESVGHWKFRDDLRDISRSGSHLSNIGITSNNFTAGITETGITACVIGNGDVAYLDAGDAGHFGMSESSFTIESWFKTSSSDVIYPIKHLNDYFGWGFLIAASGFPVITLGDGGLAWEIQSGSIEVADNAWHYIGIVVDRLNSRINMYVDGVEDIASPFTITNISGSLDNPNSELRIGESFSPATMTIDELCITKKTFTSAEILQHYTGHGIPSDFNYSGSSTVTSNIVNTNLNSFDIQLKHVCNHLLSTGQKTLDTCSRCLGAGYYFDIRFDATGRPPLLSIEDKLMQSLEKMVLTTENKFHTNVSVDLKDRIGEFAVDVETVIKYDLQNAVGALRQNQRSATNLSSRAQISTLDGIEVIKISPTSYTYIVQITTVSGESLELTGTVNLSI